ncbi:MAG: FecR domain-containing protein [Dongiaceae bacterium]
MPSLPLNESRRKRLTSADASSSSREGGVSIARVMIGLIIAAIIAICLIAPNQVDNAIGRVVPTGDGKSADTNQVWSSVVSALSSEDVEHDQVASSSTSSSWPVLQPNQSVTTGSTGQTVLTRGHDILEIGPQSTISIGESQLNGSAAIIDLLNGTIHVEAAKRTGGQTLSIKTTYLVATVKGTKFDVATTDDGTAVSVTEGVVSVKAAGSSSSVDVTLGVTAVVLSSAGGVPVVGPTPSEGAAAAIEAAKAIPTGDAQGFIVPDRQ